MKPISAATGRPLRWNRASRLGRDFELRAGDDSVGALSFRSVWGSLATANAADGTWTFKRTGLWRPEITVRVSGSDANIAVFRNNTWKGGGTLEFRDGRTFRATNNWWATRFEILSDRDEILMALRASAWTDSSAEVETDRKPRGSPHCLCFSCSAGIWPSSRVAMRQPSPQAPAVVPAAFFSSATANRT